MKETIIKLAAVVATVFTPMLATAQWKLGIEGGVVHNTLLVSKCYDYDRHYTGATNGIIGVPVRYDFRDWFGLQAEVSYLAKNYSMYRSEIYEGNYYNYTNSYINIPIFARFSFGGAKLRGYVLAGGFLGAWIDSYVEGNQMTYFQPDGQSYSDYHFDEKVPFDSRRDNRFDAGLSGALGIEYQFAKRFSVFAEGRYLYSLTDMQKNYMLSRPSKHNSTFAFMVGVIYTIKTK